MKTPRSPRNNYTEIVDSMHRNVRQPKGHSSQGFNWSFNRARALAAVAFASVTSLPAPTHFIVKRGARGPEVRYWAGSKAGFSAESRAQAKPVPRNVATRLRDLHGAILSPV